MLQPENVLAGRNMRARHPDGLLVEYVEHTNGDGGSHLGLAIYSSQATRLAPSLEASGPLSYVRLGWAVLQAPDLRPLMRRLVHWLGIFLWISKPCWHPWQRRYRLRHWWPGAEAA